MTIENETIDRLLHHTDAALKVYLWVALHDGESVGLRKLAKELNLTFQNVRSAVKWLTDRNLIGVLPNTPPNTQSNTPPNTPKVTVNTFILISCRDREAPPNTPHNTQSNTPPNTTKEENRKEEKFPPLNPPIKEENIKEEKTPLKSARAKKNPTLEEVRAYFEEKGITDIDADGFWSFYEANGWVQGNRNKPIKDWKQCVVTWRRMPFYRQPQGMNVGVLIQGSANPNRFDNDETW